MKTSSPSDRTYDHPVRIVQFGEGNFLRAFWDKAIHELNLEGKFKGQIAVVQPIERGLVNELARQDYQYTVCLQSQGDESLTKVESIKTGINPYTEFDRFLELAKSPDLRIVISNTTEAGIVYDEEDSLEARPPRSFPVKLLLFLKTRYQAFSGKKGSGLLLFPSELIENNGDALKRVLVQLAGKFALDKAFVEWLQTENFFFNTLVDGIVTGYPKDEIDALQSRIGYEDRMLVKGESYQILVIKGDETFRGEFPIEHAKLNVVWTDDLRPYRDIKVRVMNGFQTHLSHIGYLAGIETEREALNDAQLGPYLNKMLYDEIVPSLPFPKEDVLQFADKMLVRLDNPFIRHLLRDINLNSFSKFQTRLQPSMEYWTTRGTEPTGLLFALAATIAFYHVARQDGKEYFGSCCGLDYPLYDTPAILKSLQEVSAKHPSDVRAYCLDVLSDSKLWMSVPNLTDRAIEMVVSMAVSIKTNGIFATVGSIREGGF